ncbi:MAG: DsrE family protein [Bacteroidales bacterium]
MKSTVLLFTGNGMGTAPEDLSRTLTKNYLSLLCEENKVPAALLFYGEGVKLVCEGSPVLESMSVLEARGVKLLVCKTCLNYFGLPDKIKAGQVGTMADILTMQLEAGKVISV